MSKPRGLFFSLGLAAMTGLMASEARAETLTLSVFAGTDTTAPAIYSVVGGSTAVSAETGILNGNLAGAGFGAYSFSELRAASNNPGTSGPVGGFIETSGTLNVDEGGSGEGTFITGTVSEGGFDSPTSGHAAQIATTATAQYVGTVAGTNTTPSTQLDQSMFTDNSSPPVAVMGGVIHQPSNGTPLDSHSDGNLQGLPADVTPYRLENILNLSLVAVPGGGGGIDSFTAKTQVAAMPEPSGVVMLWTGAVGLLVCGAWRRTRA